MYLKNKLEYTKNVSSHFCIFWFIFVVVKGFSIRFFAILFRYIKLGIDKIVYTIYNILVKAL